MHRPTLPAAGLFDLHGRVALVTAGATGIGQAVAIALAQAGADLAITEHQRSGAATREAIEGLGRQCLVLNADLFQRSAAEQVVQQVQQHFGHLDIAVNNAGTIRRAAALDTLDEDWDAVLQLNLDSAWRICRAAGRRMVAQGQGKIINIASLLSLQGGLRVPAYAASKHALLGLTRALANEWAGGGVCVNAIAPGYIETSNTEALRADPERQRQVLERIPAGRWGRPEDLAGAAVFLAAPASNYLHGHLLVVDGGWTSR